MARFIGLIAGHDARHRVILGSVAGAFLAGVLLGIVSTVSAFYIGQYVTTIVLLAAAALTIVVRPRGLLGR